MELRVLVPPAEEPVSPREAITLTHLRLEQDVDEALVELYIRSAREACEVAARRAFVTQTLMLELPAFPAAGCIELPRPPLQSVTAVRFYDASGELQTLDPSLYRVVGGHGSPVVTPAPMPGRVMLRSGSSWPATDNRADAVQVEYVAGYGAPADVPAAIRHAILVHTADSYAHRETIITGTSSSELPRAVAALLMPYWVP